MSENEITAEQAQEALDKAKARQLELCAAELAVVLRQHDCKLTATPLIVKGGIVAQVTVEANE